MFRKINYFCYPVADMDRAISFYTEVLGLTLVRRGDKWSELQVGEQRIALMLLPERAGEGGARVEFVVDQLDKVMESLQAKGVPIQNLEPAEEGPVKVFQDSEGNEIAIFSKPE